MHKEKNTPDFYGLIVTVTEAPGLKERFWAYFAGICDIQTTQTQISNKLCSCISSVSCIIYHDDPKAFSLKDIFYPVSISTWFRGECTLK